ncbi:VOC family protein [Natronosalvus rutilus]|uniref:VOC family protein n=1 Tax=Natronosalvus rutilus TaxID=2953753 RepID=A0A9E7N978_9EURY|nr:VOC family protein [Natronosalvus rutilus]UTF52595.1 VOC family protein [Natronosalvus rutilus]
MEITVTSVPVDDQQKALEFYTNVLGFEKKTDEPVGEASWLTLVGPDSPDGVELLLEPTENPTIDEELEAYRDALVTNGIPWTMFGCEDVEAEYERLSEHGVEFTQEPMTAGNVTMAVFDDTCGNLIQLVQQ